MRRERARKTATFTSEGGATVVLLPTLGGDARLSEEAVAAAFSTLHATLEAEGFTVSTLDEVQNLPEELRGCAEGPCLDEIRRRAATDYIGVLTLWGRGGERTAPRQVVVSLIDGLSQDFYSRLEINGDLNATIAEAVRTAVSHIRVGPGPFIFVDGSPDNAEVYIDGEYAGVIPYRDEITPGTHDIAVRHDGYASANQTETVPADVVWTARLTFNLEPEGGASSSGAGADTWPSWLVGGGLLAGAIGAAIAPVWTLATEGECLSGPEQTCREWVAFDAGMGVLLGVSAALLASAIVIAITQPISIGASVSPDGARLQLLGSF